MRRHQLRPRSVQLLGNDERMSIVEFGIIQFNQILGLQVCRRTVAYAAKAYWLIRDGWADGIRVQGETRV